jgi:hypothetical protein
MAITTPAITTSECIRVKSEEAMLVVLACVFIFPCNDVVNNGIATPFGYGIKAAYGWQ